MKVRKLACSAALASAILSVGIINHESKAATNTQSVSGVLQVKYNGAGKVRLLNANGTYQDQYLAKNTKWKVFEKGTIRNQTMYRLGTQKQWIPAKYTNWGEGAKTTSASHHQKATNRKAVSGVAQVIYRGAGKVRLLDSNGTYQDQYIAKNTKWKVFESANINGRLMYRLGNDRQWVPASLVRVYLVNHNGSVVAPSHNNTASKPANNGSKPSTPSKSNNGNKPAVNPGHNGGQTSGNTNKPSQPSQNHSGAWTQADIQAAQTEFINYVNAWREKEGLQPFSNDVSWLQQGAETRANDNMQMFQSSGNISHTRPNGTDWDTAFNVGGQLGGENIGYVGNSAGYTPQEAARSIAQGFIDEGPQGGHYAVLHAEYGNHPAIGVAFRNVYRNGQQVYIMNMETGTNARIASVGSRIQGDAEHDETWAAQWKGMMAPSMKQYVYTQGGRIHVEQSKFPTETGYNYKYTQMNYLPQDQLQAFENAFVQYMKTKYNAIIE